MMRRARRMLLAAAALAACGGDGGGDRTFDGQYDDPGDFSRAVCAAGALAGAPRAGIWNVNVVTSALYFSISLRVDEAGGGLTAQMIGRDAEVIRTDDDQFVRVEYRASGGDPRLLVVDVCGTDADAQGSYGGNAVYCANGACYAGNLQAHWLERMAGEEEADGLVKVGEWNHPASDGVALNVRVWNQVAYLIVRAGLHILDVSDPAHPRPLGFVPIGVAGAGYNDVKIVPWGDKVYALLASDNLGVIIVDVTDPAAPRQTGRIGMPANGAYGVHTLFVEQQDSGARAYLADDMTSGVDVWDVTDPASPSLLGEYVDPSAPDDSYRFVHDLYVEGRVAYLNYWDGGLEVVDLSDLRSPHLLGQFSGYPFATSHSNWVTTAGGRKVSVHGDEGYYAHTRIIDVDPESAEFMTEIGAFETRPWVSAHNIQAFGERAYVTHYQDGFRILDLSDPTQPRQIAYFNTWSEEDAVGESLYEGAIGVQVDLDAGLYYLADTERGLIILEETPVN